MRAKSKVKYNPVGNDAIAAFLFPKPYKPSHTSSGPTIMNKGYYRSKTGASFKYESGFDSYG